MAEFIAKDFAGNLFIIPEETQSRWDELMQLMEEIIVSDSDNDEPFVAFRNEFLKFNIKTE